VVPVLSGGNVDPLLLIKLIDHGLSAAGRYLLLRIVLTDHPGALADVTAAVAEMGLNVLDVEHHRAGVNLGLDQVEVLLTLETRDPAQRELAQFNLLPDLVRDAMAKAPGWAAQLEGIDPASVTSRAALAKLPVLRKSALKDLQAKSPPYGGFTTAPAASLSRIFMSPGPIFEPEGFGEDWWRTARALFSAGMRKGDIVHNTFASHLTPGAWLLDSGARALGCAVIAAGPGQTEQQLDIIQYLKPTAYVGVPDYLKILLDKAKEAGREVKIGRFPFIANGKALGLGDYQGFVKLVSDAKYGELLGAHLIGPEVTELLPELTLAHNMELTAEEIARNVHAHPSLSETLMEAAHGLVGGYIQI